MTDQHQQNVKSLRLRIIEMVHRAGEGHIPSAFSIIDVLYTLYRDCLRLDPKNVNDPNRDYFLLSKGHAGAALYATLAHFGFLNPDELMSYCQPGSRFGGHPDIKVPGVEVCSGSLGHGVAMAAGVAMANRQLKRPGNVVVLVGDGEMEEGSFWETVMLARNTNLSKLVVIADCNDSQIKYSAEFDFVKILDSFGWQAQQVDGHDLAALSSCLKPLMNQERDRPAFVVAKTIKGKGVERFVAKGDNAWHRRTPTAAEMIELYEELK